MCLHVDWHITVCDSTYSTHPQPCLRYCLFKYLTRDKSLARVCFPLRAGSPLAKLSQERTNQEETGQTSSLELPLMLWQGLQKWLTWATAPGRTPGFHSGCKSLPWARARLCDSWTWGKSTRKKLPLNEADWQVGANMSVGMTGGKNTELRKCFYGAIKSRDYLCSICTLNFWIFSMLQSIKPRLKWKNFVCLLVYLTGLTCLFSIHTSCPENHTRHLFTTSLLPCSRYIYRQLLKEKTAVVALKRLSLVFEATRHMMI